MRVVEAGRADAADDRTETRLFSALDGAFRDVPPSRIGGAVMITDGQVHDVPGDSAGFHAPLHALITGEENERDRRIRFESAPRFGIVGKPLDMTYRVIDTDGEAGPVDVRVSINGEQVSVAARLHRPGNAAADHRSERRPQHRRARRSTACRAN